MDFLFPIHISHEKRTNNILIIAFPDLGNMRNLAYDALLLPTQLS